MVSTDKKEWRRSIKSSEEANELQPLSPPEDSFLHQLASSPYGSFGSGRLRHSSEVSASGSDNDLDENGQVVVGTVSRKTLFHLVSVLNLSYSDYDFTCTKSESFSLLGQQDAINNVNANFTSTVRDFSSNKNTFWNTIDNEIKLDQCIIYRYVSSNYNINRYTKKLIQLTLISATFLHTQTIRSQKMAVSGPSTTSAGTRF